MDEIMNRIGEVYEPFKVHFLHKPVRPLAQDEVLVKVRASAICGSDLHIARGLHPSAPLPVTIGHEFPVMWLPSAARSPRLTSVSA